MGRTYRAHKTRPKSRRTTLRGGDYAKVAKIIEETEILPGGIHIINPKSKFIVATYWWGVANMNANLQKPCPEDIEEIVRKEALTKLLNAGTIRKTFPREVVDTMARLRDTRKVRTLTPAEAALTTELRAKWDVWVKSVMTDPKLKAEIDKVRTEVKAANVTVPPRTFKVMIDEWKETCTRANVNFVELNTEFAREDYQNAINGKPLFIKKVLDAVKDRGLGVLYIDGDMWVNKYPDIFDMENVDFMARGWNMDCRTKENAIAKPFYDPYTFETSGGTMYFGNTQTARDLLDQWGQESTRPEQKGKADDRILSQLFTTRSLVVGTNLINLPIEYLWLTDLYKNYLKDATSPASIEDAYIEHPACLTGEERATDQGAASSREPVGYEEEVTDNINYKRPPELFYEYIYFDGNAQMRDGFGRYLKYMKTAINFMTKEPLMKIVDFADQYGEYNEIAKKNLAAVGSVDTPSAEPVKVSLPSTASIPDILKVLTAGNHVELGGPLTVNPEDEVVAYTNSTTPVDMYTRTVKLDTTWPMFISGKCKIIRHALTMCETLADLNKHIEGSYTFMSRIRWNLLKIPAVKKQSPVALPDIAGGFTPKVHQIWFGGEIPQWRKIMFDANRAICEAHGFKYSLWRNEDRTEENFPITLAYQNTAIEKGKETEQNRWAQVADLARLEVIYQVGGIYIDSLIEITPAFLKAISDAIKGGATFVGCNEDPCEPPADCVGNAGRKYLTNSFFAATKANPILKRLLEYPKLDAIDFNSEFINRTTGPYYLREGIVDVVADKVFMLDSSQIFPFNQQPTPYKEVAVPDRFLFKEYVPGSIKVKEGMFYLPGGAEILQTEFVVGKKGPLAVYHSGLGGTWST